jgi:hypothetical protein
MQMLEVRSRANNADKMTCYAPTHEGVWMRFGDQEGCLDAAVTGKRREILSDAVVKPVR